MERSIFGTAEPGAPRTLVQGFSRAHLGSGLEEILFRATGVGVSIGIRLEDGRRVLLKAYQPQVSRSYLSAVHRIQARLHEESFPCPRPLLPPRRFANGFARVEELCPVGEVRDAARPSVRRAMAELLARQIALISGKGRPEALRQGWTPFAGSGLWPPRGHHPLIRLDAAPPAADWIDPIAARVKPASSGGRLVVGHGDWTARNMRFTAGRISMVYDWDSLQLDDEERLLGGASLTFLADAGAVRVATPDQARAFVDEYDAAREQPLKKGQRKRVAAARTFVLAYHARAEYARGRASRNGSYASALRERWREYLEP